jgi:UDP-N-acetylmuramoyl-L-alanyl-D-glutamate--2,6-diaminopimelate ligase
MMLNELIQGLPIKNIHGKTDAEIRGVTQDSRRVAPGFLFVAVPGNEQNGHLFIPDAVKKGAAAVMLSESPDLSLSVPQIEVKDSRSALADVAARFYGEPSMKMKIVGITGTNGKTTLTYLLESILKEAGRNPAVLGTINYRYGGKIFPAANTTPESVDLQKLFSEMVSDGVTDVVMEVSSHALALNRVRGVHFDVGVFTNLSQDHLDFHEDIEDYFQAKLRLFCEFLPESRKKEKSAVVNMEDERGEEIVLLKDDSVRQVRVALTGPYEISCRSFHLSEEGIRAEVMLGSKILSIRSALMGQFNLENILCAIGVADGLGIPEEAVIRGIENLKSVPGRLEKIQNDRGILAFVDYAHTPEALARVGESLRKMTRGRMITVFGCGGDRDRSKRALMGCEAARMSDWLIVTSDNPRTENPETIIDEIIPGIESVGFSKERFCRISSREEALKKAVEIARRGDLILVAGKGHEDYQIVGKQKSHFSDREILKRLLA